ncbi:hypothetical protein RGQ29_019923 [Quercus rubra]|uniref:Uncharacterized protein n=1 Tax=Quercus rubra TaxID=3512 RepID=A0AAN7FA81_QUERU|nr:hypothetical protein RGQ29_019923 [Quercus rubra]
MANSRIARFVSEVAPPQYISVIRQRTSKMLDTIKEEERDASANDSHAVLPRSSSSTSTSSASSATTTNSDSKYFLREVHKSFSVFDH